MLFMFGEVKNPVNELVYGYGGVKLLPNKTYIRYGLCSNRYDN